MSVIANLPRLRPLGFLAEYPSVETWKGERLDLFLKDCKRGFPRSMFVRLLFQVLLRYSTVAVYLFSFLRPIRVKPRKPRLQSSRTASYLSPPRVASQLAKKPSGDKVGKLRANFVLYSLEFPYTINYVNSSLF